MELLKAAKAKAAETASFLSGADAKEALSHEMDAAFHSNSGFSAVSAFVDKSEALHQAESQIEYGIAREAAIQTAVQAAILVAQGPAKAAKERAEAEAKAAKEREAAEAKAAKEREAAEAKAAREREAADAKAAKEREKAEAKAAKAREAADAKAAKEREAAEAQATRERAAEQAKAAKERRDREAAEEQEARERAEREVKFGGGGSGGSPMPVTPSSPHLDAIREFNKLIGEFNNVSPLRGLSRATHPRCSHSSCGCRRRR